MLSEGGPIGFGLSLALTNKQDPSQQEVAEEVVEREKKQQLKKEVDILVNQIGKMNRPIG